MDMAGESLTGKDLTDYFVRRDQQIAILDTERDTLAQICLDLMPAGLTKYRAETFNDVKRMTNFLQNLYDHRTLPFGAEDRFKNPSDYGFRDNKDAYEKMLLLKTAWQGIIDVKVDNSGWYVEVKFALPEQKPKE